MKREEYKLDRQKKLIFAILLIWLLTFVLITIFADIKKAALISTFMGVFFWIIKDLTKSKKK